MDACVIQSESNNVIQSESNNSWGCKIWPHGPPKNLYSLLFLLNALTTCRVQELFQHHLYCARAHHRCGTHVLMLFTTILYHVQRQENVFKPKTNQVWTLGILKAWNHSYTPLQLDFFFVIESAVIWTAKFLLLSGILHFLPTVPSFGLHSITSLVTSVAVKSMLELKKQLNLWICKVINRTILSVCKHEVFKPTFEEVDYFHCFQMVLEAFWTSLDWLGL